jgi:hypothetical protein
MRADKRVSSAAAGVDTGPAGVFVAASVGLMILWALYASLTTGNSHDAQS